jgi:very-short-patch-repair endonuclease
MLCTKKKFRRGKDRFNYPINEKYIADVVNYKFMYVIEIDERYHEQPDRKRLDEIRDAALKCLGFNVFRIRAYNLQDFNSVVDSIRKLRFDRRVFSELNQDYAKYERKSKRVSCQSGNMLELWQYFCGCRMVGVLFSEVCDWKEGMGRVRKESGRKKKKKEAAHSSPPSEEKYPQKRFDSKEIQVFNQSRSLYQHSN